MATTIHDRLVGTLTTSAFWRGTIDTTAKSRKYTVIIPHPELRKDYVFYVGSHGALRYGKTIASSISTDARGFLERWKDLAQTA